MPPVTSTPGPLAGTPLAGTRVPAVYVLAGLECNEETFAAKAGAQRAAAELGLALVTSDTSPRATRLPGDDAAWEAVWQESLAVNLVAPLRLVRRAAGSLRVVVNLLDIAVWQAWPSYTHYAAAKAGLAWMTRTLAVALAPAVRVVGVAPGVAEFPESMIRAAHGEPGHLESVATEALGAARRYARATRQPTQPSRAARRSSQRSSTSSMPTDSRTSPSGMVAASAFQRRRRSRLDSTPPSEVAWIQSRVLRLSRSAAISPWARTMLTIAPNPG